MSTHHIATLHMGLPREDMGLPKDFVAKEAKEREALLAEREAAGPTPAKARYLDGLPFTPFAS